MRCSRRLALAAFVLSAVALLGAQGVTRTQAADGAQPVLGVTVEPNRPERVASSVTLAVQPLPVTVGQPATFTATVSCAPHDITVVDSVVSNGAGPRTPTGSVTFTGNGSVLAVVALSNGSASFTLTIPASPSLVVVALYSGDERCASAVSAPLSLPSPFAMVNTQFAVTLGIATKGCGSTTPPPATVVNLFQAIPIAVAPCPGSTFIGWTNGPCTGTQMTPCDIAPDGLTTITATFAP
jgi:hypothetical protein